FGLRGTHRFAREYLRERGFQVPFRYLLVRHEPAGEAVVDEAAVLNLAPRVQHEDLRRGGRSERVGGSQLLVLQNRKAEFVLRGLLRDLLRLLVGRAEADELGPLLRRRRGQFRERLRVARGHGTVEREEHDNGRVLPREFLPRDALPVRGWERQLRE